MSEHVLDRLGAYLDAELPPAEAAAVSGHLRECPRCSRHLEELGAVDRLVRSLAAEPADGYFDSLPGRVRERLAPPAKRRSAPPLWTLAAAAALLLAVLTPLTLQRMRPVMPAAEEARPAAGAVQPMPATPSVAGVPPEATAPKPQPRARESKRASEATADEDVGAVVIEPTPRSIPIPRPGAAGAESGQMGTNAFVDPWDTVANQRRVDEAAAARKEADLPAPEGRARDEEAPAALARSNQSAPFASGLAAGERSAPPSPTQARYRALLARRADTADEARALREAWRALARDVALDPAADEIREQAVEAAAETYRLTGDPRDLDELRRDAGAYLARADALRAERVRELLQELER